jgi:hypothetical protein
MLLRQSFKTSADSMEFLNFVQYRLKRHEYPLLGEPWGALQMDWLRSEDLKEEKVVTTSRMQPTTRESEMLATSVTTIVSILTG